MLNSGRNLLAEAEYENKLALIDQKIADIENRDRRFTVSCVSVAMIRQKAEEDRTHSAQQRQAKINEQLDRVRALMSEPEVRGSAAGPDSTLFLDPINPAALFMKDIAGHDHRPRVRRHPQRAWRAFRGSDGREPRLDADHGHHHVPGRPAPHQPWSRRWWRPRRPRRTVGCSRPLESQRIDTTSTTCWATLSASSRR